MTVEDERDRLRDRIHDIDETIDRLRRETGTRSDDPEDVGDAARDLTGAEEQFALIETLEVRRQALMDRLDQLSRTGGESDHSEASG